MNIAITGSIGSGKSEMGRFLGLLGYPVIDTDKLAAEVLRRGSEVYSLLVEDYGDRILDEDGDIDRKTLADILFTDENEKSKIEGWMHPAIWGLLDERYLDYPEEKFIFVEVPLLFETNSQSRFDRSVLVLTDQEIAIERLMAYRNIDREEAYRRWRNQMDPELKKELADDILFNNGNLDDLRKQIESYMMKLEALT
jgi:dephospho-CoA kinase